MYCKLLYLPCHVGCPARRKKQSGTLVAKFTTSASWLLSLVSASVHCRAGGFDMGAAVPVAEPQWSGAHVGLALYLLRLLAPLGDRPLAQPQDPRKPDGMLAASLPAAALEVCGRHTHPHASPYAHVQE